MNRPTDCDCHDHDSGRHSHPDVDPGIDEHDSVADHRVASDIHHYSGHGVRFQYPQNWTLTEESGPDQTTITVQSPKTSYWMISLFADQPAPERIVKSVMDAYESLYDDLDVYEPDVHVLGFPAITRELDFVCLDLVTTAGMIVFEAVDQSVLVMFQGEDRELEETRPLIDAITRSLLCEMNADETDDEIDGDDF